ncbi:MAG: hypothetical protein ACI97N_000311 [Cognaticolwellia sp.]|jgi:hypothetical protein
MTTKDLTSLLKGELTEQIAAYINSENPFPESIIDWLAQLVLLQNIPFNNLVADENLLPNESLRLFYLDENWTNAMLDGALSIGIHSERDLMLQEAMNDIIRQSTNKKLGAISSKEQPENQVTRLGTISGLIIRSAIVSNYKGLEISAFENNGIGVNTLRIERLAANILFVLFDTIPAKIEIKAPSESRTLAIINNEIPLRQLENEVGKITDTIFKVRENHFRNVEKRVLNISALQQSIANQLGKNQLSPSAFGIQLMQSPKVFQLVNENIDIIKSREVIVETNLDKNLIFNKLFK